MKHVLRCGNVASIGLLPLPGALLSIVWLAVGNHVRSLSELWREAPHGTL